MGSPGDFLPQQMHVSPIRILERSYYKTFQMHVSPIRILERSYYKTFQMCQHALGSSASKHGMSYTILVARHLATKATLQG